MFSTTRKSLFRTLQSIRRMSNVNLQNLTFEPLTDDRIDEVTVHLREVYKDTPIYRAAGLIGSGASQAQLDKVYLDSIKEGISLMALDEGKLAGVLINGILTPDAIPGAVEEMKKSTDEKYKKLDYLFLALLQELDIFNRFGIDRAMECRLLSTSRKYRGSGLGKILVDKLTETAQVNDFPLIVGEAVNDFLWRLLVAEGWIMLRQMPYGDYIDEATGKPVYNVDPPHHILGICSRIVDNKCKCKDPLPLPSPKIYYPIKMD